MDSLNHLKMIIGDLVINNADLRGQLDAMPAKLKAEFESEQALKSKQDEAKPQEATGG